MRYIDRFFYIYIVLILSVAGCTTAPMETATATSVPMVTSTLAPPTTAPPTPKPDSTLKAGQWSFMFYHDELGQVVLVNGGPEQGKPADDPLELWGWNGTQWSLIEADENGPAWRNWAAVGYDSERDVLVVHGGPQASNMGLDETWEWDGQAWMRFAGPGPGVREGSLMVYDPARAKMVLFGGAENMDVKGDTWEWDGQAWVQVSETGPAPRFPGAMTYDPLRQQVLLYSGHFASSTGEFIDYGDLWAWDGTSWREIPLDEPTPGHRTHTVLVFDPHTESVLLFGGGVESFKGDIWAWDGMQWTELPTSNMPARSGSSVVYDAARDRFVFFGGVDRPGAQALTDTWEWDRTQWLCVSNCQ